MGGLYCAEDNKCATAGSGLPGALCSSTADCVRGAVCIREAGQVIGSCRVPRGAGPITLADGGMVSDDGGGVATMDGGASASGPRDVNGACTDTLDCLAGLLCDPSTNKCARAAAVNMSRAPRAVTCGADMAGVNKAYFEVPNDDGSPRSDFFRLPFPNNVRRDPMSGRLNLRGFPTPGTALLGFDLVDRYARAAESSLNGFGNNQWVYFRFSSQPDFATLQLGTSIRLIDLTTSQPIGFQTYRFDGNQGRYICANWLGVTTSAGVPFAPGHTIAVVLTTAIRTAGGMPFSRDSDFDAVINSAVPADARLARAHTAYQPLRQYLTAQMIDPNTILNAAVFTVQDPRAQFEGVARAVRAAPMPVARDFVRCAEGVRSPCDDGLTGSDHVRGCIGPANPAFDEYQGTIDVPILQQGTRPYRNPGEGAIAYDAMGTAMVQGTERVCVSVAVPRNATMPASGWPTVLYAHGTGGNFRSGITEGLAETLSDFPVAGGSNAHFAIVSYEGVMHGARRGMGVTDSPNVLFFNFANPEAARDNVLQGGADVLAIARALRGGSITTMGGSELRFDAAKLVFLGHSQGSTVGAAAAAYDGDFAARVLSGAGGDLRFSLTTKTQPVNIAGLVPVVLGEPGGADHPAMQLFQAFVERSDAVNFGARLLADRAMGVALRPLVMTYGLGDTYSTPATMQALATAIGLPAAAPIPGGMNQWPTGTGVTLPAMNNVDTGSGSTTALLLESDPMGAYDGHFVLFRDAALRAQVLTFIATATDGTARVPARN
jgi:pimeloyl-ACP methyl ester carboxylesterase